MACRLHDYRQYETAGNCREKSIADFARQGVETPVAFLSLYRWHRDHCLDYSKKRQWVSRCTCQDAAAADCP